MTATKNDAPNEVEGTGFKKSLHGDDEIVYLKDHTDGRVTAVNINWEFYDCGVYAEGFQDGVELGTVEVATVPAGEDRTPAVEAAVEWMQANPDGVGR